MTAISSLAFPDSAPLELATVGDWWRFAVTSLLRGGCAIGQGSEDAGQDALFVVLGALDLPLDSFEAMRSCVLTHAERRHVFAVLRRRVIERTPTAYILGFAEQMGRRFIVNEHTLIPRSFIGELLEHSLQECIDDPARIASVLDLCTGSGCLAILAADAFPDATLVAADISEHALDVARQNVALHGLDDVIDVRQGDLFAAVGAVRFDLILSNPPYVTDDSMQGLPDEYRQEPALALAAGGDGCDVLRRLIAEARAHLNDDGWLVVDIGHNRGLVEAAFPSLPFIWLATAGHEGGVFALQREALP